MQPIWAMNALLRLLFTTFVAVNRMRKLRASVRAQRLSLQDIKSKPSRFRRDSSNLGAPEAACRDLYDRFLSGYRASFAGGSLVMRGSDARTFSSPRARDC